MAVCSLFIHLERFEESGKRSFGNSIFALSSELNALCKTKHLRRKHCWIWTRRRIFSSREARCQQFLKRVPHFFHQIVQPYLKKKADLLRIAFSRAELRQTSSNAFP